MQHVTPPATLWNRNFTLLWQGQIVSSIGKQTFALAAMLWLKQITESGTLMGLVMTAALAPMVILGPIAGVLVDRWDRRRLIAWTDLAGGFLVLGAAAFLPLSRHAPRAHRDPLRGDHPHGPPRFDIPARDRREHPVAGPAEAGWRLPTG